MPHDYEENRRYFARTDGEIAHCLQCAGQMLTYSIQQGGRLGYIADEDGVPQPVTLFDGISGQTFVELTRDEVQMWRDTNLQFDMDPWVCDHEMIAHLNSRVC